MVTLGSMEIYSRQQIKPGQKCGDRKQLHLFCDSHSAELPWLVHLVLEEGGSRRGDGRHHSGPCVLLQRIGLDLLVIVGHENKALISLVP